VLELRTSCENCATALPPRSAEARICTFECTFCRTCVDKVLSNVCPNCGGGFVPRPVRPSKNWKAHQCLLQYPATVKVTSRPVDAAAHRAFAERLKDISPDKR